MKKQITAVFVAVLGLGLWVPQANFAQSKGLSFQSEDGEFKAQLKGFFQTQSRTVLESSAKTQSGFANRRIRTDFKANLGKNTELGLFVDYASGTALLQDAYIDATVLPGWKLKSGKFKVLFGLEQTQSPTNVHLTELSFATSLVPNRDLGIELRTAEPIANFNYSIGVFNGVTDGSSADTDTESGKDVFGKISYVPNKSTLIGLSVSTGGRNGSSTLASYKTAAQTTFFKYAGTTADGALTRISPHGYWYGGPFGVYAEYVTVSQALKKGTLALTAQQSAWQITGVYVLTGETPTYGTFETKGNSVELVGRIHQLTVDESVFDNGFADTTTATYSRATGIVAGVNWYLNSNVKLSASAEQVSFDTRVANGAGKETLVTLQSQVTF